MIKQISTKTLPTEPKTSTTAPKTSPKPKIASMQQQEPQFHRFNPIRCVDLSTDDEKKLRECVYDSTNIQSLCWLKLHVPTHTFCTTVQTRLKER